MNELRKIERLVDGEWVPCRLIEIRKGDRFRIHEADGEFVVEEIAFGDAYLNDNQPVVYVKRLELLKE